MAKADDPSAREAAEWRAQLRAKGLSDYLLDELEQDKVDLPRVDALLEYGRAADRLGTPAARRRHLEEARAILEQMTLLLPHAISWYQEHVDDDAGSPERQRRPVYRAVIDLLALLENQADDPLIVAAARPRLPPSREGRPERPWLQEIREGLAEAGCEAPQITDILTEARFHPKPKTS